MIKKRSEERLKGTSSSEQDGPTASFRIPPPQRWLVPVSALVCLLAGISCVLAVKFQNRAKVPVCADEDCAVERFVQPFWQTFIMFAGESFCLLIYFYARWRRDRRGDKIMLLEFPDDVADFNKSRMPWWWWSLSAILDIAGTALVNMAFGMSYASTIQMLRNAILLMTSFFTVTIMRRPLKVHEAVGILVMTAGLVFAGLQAIRNPDEETDIDTDKAWLGVVLTLIGTVFNAFQLIIEEWFFRKAYCPPMKAMGCQGIIGFFINIWVILVAHYIDAYNFQEGWYQMNHSGQILGSNLWYLSNVFLFNGGGICITKLGSGLLRAVVYSLRAPIVWVIELIAGWQAFAWEQLVALILSAVGFAFYSYILPGLTPERFPLLASVLKVPIPCFCTQPEEDVEVTPRLTATTDNYQTEKDFTPHTGEVV